MTTKIKSNANRPNYAKRAKEFGLEYISITNIQKYFEEDWEKKIESSKLRFDWRYIFRSLNSNNTIHEMENGQFQKFLEVLGR